MTVSAAASFAALTPSPANWVLLLGLRFALLSLISLALCCVAGLMLAWAYRTNRQWRALNVCLGRVHFHHLGIANRQAAPALHHPTLDAVDLASAQRAYVFCVQVDGGVGVVTSKVESRAKPAADDAAITPPKPPCALSPEPGPTNSKSGKFALTCLALASPERR